MDFYVRTELFAIVPTTSIGRPLIVAIVQIAGKLDCFFRVEGWWRWKDKLAALVYGVQRLHA